MKSVIGAFRDSDNRNFHDRSYGRPAPTDFIARFDDSGIRETVPTFDNYISKRIVLAVSECMKEDRTEITIDNIHFQIYEVINNYQITKNNHEIQKRNTRNE